MTAADYARATRLLGQRDPVLRTLVRKHGRCGLGDQHTDPFEALVTSIISQQLSTKAAATITARFTSLFGGRRFPTPRRVAAMPDDQLRAVGLSGQKLGYIRDLCRRIDDKSLPLASLGTMTDEEVVTTLTAVKGIGRWTAEMFLMFRLQRPDVLPVGDLGIVKAVQKHYRLRKVPTAQRLEKIGENWRPYRSIACWYLWRSLDNKPMD